MMRLGSCILSTLSHGDVFFSDAIAWSLERAGLGKKEKCNPVCVYSLAP